MMTYEQRRWTAKHRKLVFELTREQHDELQKSPCSYCGGESGGGIDRVDTKQGYVWDNCVAACMRCNARKQVYEPFGPEYAVDKAIELAHRNKIPPPSKREWRMLGFYKWGNPRRWGKPSSS